MPENQKNEPIVSFKDVTLAFGSKVVLKDLSFDIYPKEIVSIAGPSGSGKSTILKLISNLLIPTSGEVIVKAERFGMAFQRGALFNSMTVKENIALALNETTKLDKNEIEIRIKDSLRIVKLTGTEELYPDELSGGMQKRVSIARALALYPDILLYDEPSTGLDPATAADLEKDMVKLRNEIGLTSVVVTHDIATLKNVSDRILILDEGRIIWQGDLEDFLSSNNEYPCSFRERTSLEECRNKYKK